MITKIVKRIEKEREDSLRYVTIFYFFKIPFWRKTTIILAGDWGGTTVRAINI